MDELRFKDSWRRIDRAIAHAKSVVKQWGESFDPDATPTIERRGEGKFVARIKMSRTDDNDMALELGEYFYQLRAALDGVAYEAMVLDTSSDPPPKADRVEFPIYLDQQRFNACPFIKLTAFPEELTEWLESVQPYRIGLSDDPAINKLGQRLKVLHDFARLDRHRRLHVVVAGMSDVGVGFQHTSNVLISNVHAIPMNFLAEEADFLGFDADFGKDGETSIMVRIQGSIQFAIVGFPDYIGQAVIEELESITSAVRHVVGIFEGGYRT